MREVMSYCGEDGDWVAESPSLPGCISHVKARWEAIKECQGSNQFLHPRL